jgi:type IV secretory pathway VirB9-like protein
MCDIQPWRVQSLTWVLLCALWTGCAHKEEGLPPLPPMPEDLSTWTVPELVQPPRPDPTATKVRPATKEEQLVEFKEGVSTTVLVPTNAPLDILLQPGEEVRDIAGGDAGAQAPSAPTEGSVPAPLPQIRWEKQEGKHGSGETLQHHVYLHAKAPGLTMGVIITTTKRVYYLMCKSVKASQVRVVRWKYPEEVVPVALSKEPGLLPNPHDKKLWHLGYTVTSSRPQAPDWMPRGVFDDGKKMYLVYPEIVLRQTVPVVRMIGPNGPQLVNARQFLSVVIVDQLAPRLELRVGIGEAADVVTIARGALRTIECPESPECPVFPHAAQVLAERGQP